MLSILILEKSVLCIVAVSEGKLQLAEVAPVD